MERHFEAELGRLEDRLMKMGQLVVQMIGNAMKALVTFDPELVQKVIENDDRVDKLDVKIDKLCQRIFALAQPVAKDLRLIMSALKINNDLEQMSDHAVGIARKIEGVSEYGEMITELHIDKVAGMMDILAKDVITILSSRNLAFVNDIFTQAAVIKEKTQEISARILDEMMRKTDVIVVATNLIIILSQIEQLAGYASSIAESVVFIVDGKIIKHKKTENLSSEPEAK
jgi:phosphate transport system protein